MPISDAKAWRRTRIACIGNIMIDSFELQRRAIEGLAMADQLGLAAGGYGLVTLHRPSNVDDPAVLGAIIQSLSAIAEELPLVFPIHPRTRAALERFGLLQGLARQERLRLIEPLAYNAFMSLVVTARLVVTDSGGLQEETTYLGIPCLTLRGQHRAADHGHRGHQPAGQAGRAAGRRGGDSGGPGQARALPGPLGRPQPPSGPPRACGSYAGVG